MNDIKSIIEDINKSEIVSKKVIEKIIEKIGQEEWHDLYDEYNDTVTTTGEVVIALRSLDQENNLLKTQIEKMKNCWNCEYYNAGETTCLKGKPHNSGGCFKDWILRTDKKTIIRSIRYRDEIYEIEVWK